VANRRLQRVNSLLKEVISEIVQKHVNNPKLSGLVTITNVDVSADLHHAKVYFSVIGPELEWTNTHEALQSAAGFITELAAKKVVLRYFPQLTFHSDSSVEKQMRIEKVLEEIHNEEEARDGRHSSS